MPGVTHRSALVCIFLFRSNTTRLEIYDLSGKPVHQDRLKPGGNSISVNNLSPGIYMAKIYSKEGISTRKIILTR